MALMLVLAAVAVAAEAKVGAGAAEAKAGAGAGAGADDRALRAFESLRDGFASSMPTRPEGDPTSVREIREYERALLEWRRDRVEALAELVDDLPPCRMREIVRLEMADELLRAGRANRGKRVLRDLFDCAYDDIAAEARIRQGELYAHGAPSKAIEYFEEAMKSEVRADAEIRALRHMARIYGSVLDQPSKSRACLARVVERHGDLPEADFAREALWHLEIREKGLLDVGKKTIPFEVTAMDGRGMSPAACDDKVVLIDFWSTTSVPCLTEMSRLEAAYEEYADRGLVILGIAVDRDESAVRTFVEQRGIAWPQYVDADGFANRIARLYDVRSVPTRYLLDRRGIIRFRDTSLRGAALLDSIEELVGER